VQVFAIGLNYADHADETGLEIPEQPMVFTKWTSSLAGPGAVVSLPADTVDWEVELVAVVGKGGRDIAAADALDHIAGYCIGQDISERRLQMASTPAQFSLAKSLRNFSPIGPWLTTLDEIADPMDLAIGCRREGETLQSSRTSNLIFDVPTLIEYLSARVELMPGDILFTGTPDGVGVGRRPRVFIEPGWTITGVHEVRRYSFEEEVFALAVVLAKHSYALTRVDQYWNAGALERSALVDLVADDFDGYAQHLVEHADKRSFNRCNQQ